MSRLKFTRKIADEFASKASVNPANISALNLNRAEYSLIQNALKRKRKKIIDTISILQDHEMNLKFAICNHLPCRLRRTRKTKNKEVGEA